METELLAQLAVSFVIPFMKPAAERLIEKVGEAAFGKMRMVHQTVSQMLNSNAYGRETLRRLAEDTASKGRQAALEGILVEQIQQNADFATSLQALIEEAKDLAGDQISCVINVYDGGRIEKSLQVATIRGDVHL